MDCITTRGHWLLTIFCGQDQPDWNTASSDEDYIGELTTDKDNGGVLVIEMQKMAKDGDTQ